MKDMVLTWMSSLTAPDLALAGVAAMAGLVVGYLIWGGRRRYIVELEDALASQRKRAAQIVVANRNTVDESADSRVKEKANPANRRPAASHAPDHTERSPQTAAHNSVNYPAGSPDPRQTSRLAQRQSCIGEAPEHDPERDDVEKVLAPNCMAKTVKPHPRILASDSHEGLEALGRELEKIRTLIGQSTLDTDNLKEHLDQTDTSIKRANGRLKIVVSSVGINE